MNTTHGVLDWNGKDHLLPDGYFPLPLEHYIEPCPRCRQPVLAYRALYRSELHRGHLILNPVREICTGYSLFPCLHTVEPDENGIVLSIYSYADGPDGVVGMIFWHSADWA